MCEYCNLGKELRNDNNIKSFISKSHFGYSIMAKIYETCYNLGFIKYCPICGRKLEEEKSSKADKLFEKLGYCKILNDNKCEYRKECDGDLFEIDFWMEEKEVSKNYYGDVGYITIEELKAINLKCQELGWISNN